MKKFLSVLMSLIVGVTALAFAACADNAPNNNTPSDGNGQTGGNGENGGNNGSGGAAEPQTPATSGDPASETLVVYFSWSGNTQEMANYTAEQTDAYLVEIVPEEPYEGSYNDVAYGRAQTEAETNARPAVSQATYDLIDMENYDTVLIGFPIWWHTAPMVIGTFLEHYDWTAQDNIYPFFQGASNSNQDYYDNAMNFVRTGAEGATVHEGLYCDEGATQTIDEYLAANGLKGSAQTPDTPAEETDILVVYFSAQGHTEAVAGYIVQATGGDIFELVPVDEYTSADLNYGNESSRVVQEYENEELRDVELVSATPENWESYDTVFLGYPIWWGIGAWPVNGFVAANDFTGKTVVPFCTSSSSGIGQSGALLEELAGTGNWQEGYRFRSSASESDVRDWLGDLGVI